MYLFMLPSAIIALRNPIRNWSNSFLVISNWQKITAHAGTFFSQSVIIQFASKMKGAAKKRSIK